MYFGRLTVIFGLALEAWLLVFTIAAGLQFVFLSLMAA